MEVNRVSGLPWPDLSVVNPRLQPTGSSLKAWPDLPKCGIGAVVVRGTSTRKPGSLYEPVGVNRR